VWTTNISSVTFNVMCEGTGTQSQCFSIHTDNFHRMESVLYAHHSIATLTHEALVRNEEVK